MAIHGWFLGMQDSTRPMYISISINIVNIIASATAVFICDMGFVGIAIGTLIASYIGLSPVYFHRLFKTYYGITPNDYLLNIRIDKAKNMLLFDNKSIDEIAYECGFNSSTYFSTVFKKKINESPYRFRKKELGKYEV